MDIREALSRGHDREMRDKIIAYVGKDPKRMKVLMNCFFDKNLRINQRSAWPLGFIARKQPQLMKPYHQKMMSNLDNPHHDAVIRNTVRIYEDIDIPESIEGELFERCYNYVADPKKAIAIRAFSLTILEKLTLKFPDLKNEVIDLIQEHAPHGSVGFKNRANKILKRMRKKP